MCEMYCSLHRRAFRIVPTIQIYISDLIPDLHNDTISDCVALKCRQNKIVRIRQDILNIFFANLMIKFSQAVFI